MGGARWRPRSPPICAAMATSLTLTAKTSWSRRGTQVDGERPVIWDSAAVLPGRVEGPFGVHAHHERAVACRSDNAAHRKVSLVSRGTGPECAGGVHEREETKGETWCNPWTPSATSWPRCYHLAPGREVGARISSPTPWQSPVICRLPVGKDGSCSLASPGRAIAPIANVRMLHLHDRTRNIVWYTILTSA